TVPAPAGPGAADARIARRDACAAHAARAGVDSGSARRPAWPVCPIINRFAGLPNGPHFPLSHRA
ncbi:hypothetical protein, partial [Burkholderia pseudomallei]|uniref:hypothetical protein n=1 Tax=Burkholderia pseudomallei TaxID=28450 RepID=UPI003F6714C2